MTSIACQLRRGWLFASTALLFAGAASAQDTAIPPKEDHTLSEIYTPEPKVVTPGKSASDAPSDAIVLFDGKNLDRWVSDSGVNLAATWKVRDGILIVEKPHGIITKDTFTDYQLHAEFRIPANIQGEGQARGNSGIFLASLGQGDEGYELQVLDNYNNKTYVNGMVGSLYKQAIPLANAARKPGEWQTYDVIWTAPRFNDDGSLKSPAHATVFFNGVLVENNFELKGVTRYEGKPYYIKHGAEPIKLQAHGDKSIPISYRNIWVRRL